YEQPLAGAALGYDPIEREDEDEEGGVAPGQELHAARSVSALPGRIERCMPLEALEHRLAQMFRDDPGAERRQVSSVEETVVGKCGGRNQVEALSLHALHQRGSKLVEVRVVVLVHEMEGALERQVQRKLEEDDRYARRAGELGRETQLRIVVGTQAIAREVEPLVQPRPLIPDIRLAPGKAAHVRALAVESLREQARRRELAAQRPDQVGRRERWIPPHRAAKSIETPRAPYLRPHGRLDPVACRRVDSGAREDFPLGRRRGLEQDDVIAREWRHGPRLVFGVVWKQHLDQQEGDWVGTERRGDRHRRARIAARLGAVEYGPRSSSGGQPGSELRGQRLSGRETGTEGDRRTHHGDGRLTAQRARPEQHEARGIR